MPYRLPTRLLRQAGRFPADAQRGDAQQRQADTGEQETDSGRPHMRSCHLSHGNGEDQVAGAEEQAEQHVGDDNDLPKSQFFIMMILISFCQTTIILYDSWGHGKSCRPVLLLITGSAGKKIYVIMMNHHRFSFFWRRSAMCVRMGMKCTCDMKAENKQDQCAE